MQKPEFLKDGDKVAIVSPAGKISSSQLKSAPAIFNNWGLNLIYGRHVFSEFYQFAGTDAERLADLQQILNDESIRAIFCSRGGYGTLRILDNLDFSGFQKSPKWLVGFSDITALHGILVNQLRCTSVHGPMIRNFNSPAAAKPLLFLKNLLFGNYPKYTFKANKLNRHGKGRGILVGGNLSILENMIGTQGDFIPEGKILFIEDTSEYKYSIDRMIISLKRAGKLKHLEGLIIGRFSKIKDNKTPFGKNVEEIILEHVSDEKYPVIFGFPAGHIGRNYPLILGEYVDIQSNPESSKVTFVQ